MAKELKNIGYKEVEMRESFVFYRSFYEAIKDLPRDVQGEIYTAIMEYGLYGNETEQLKPIARSVFTLIKPVIDSNYVRYENGKTGGAPKGVCNNPNGRRGKSTEQTENKPKTNQELTKNKPRTNQEQTENKHYVDVDVDVDDNKKNNPSGLSKKGQGLFSETAEIDYTRIVEMYHETCTNFPRLIKLSDARKQKIRIRFEEMNGSYDTMANVFAKMQGSKFMRGDNRNGWKATFDWIFENSKNWVKVLEGQYDNPEQPRSTNLGIGEFINQQGQRTYGSGKYIIPDDAPPRPGDKYFWNASTKQWLV